MHFTFIFCLVLLHQKHSSCNIVCKFSCSNNINTTNGMVHLIYIKAKKYLCIISVYLVIGSIYFVIITNELAIKSEESIL